MCWIKGMVLIGRCSSRSICFYQCDSDRQVLSWKKTPKKQHKLTAAVEKKASQLLPGTVMHANSQWQCCRSDFCTTLPSSTRCDGAKQTETHKAKQPAKISDPHDRPVQRLSAKYFWKKMFRGKQNDVVSHTAVVKWWVRRAESPCFVMKMHSWKSSDFFSCTDLFAHS